LLAARLARAGAWLHVQDIELGAATNLGLIRKEWLGRLVRSLYARLLRSFDEVSTISHTMRREIARSGRDLASVTQFPNWVDTQAIHPLRGENRLKRELGLDDGRLVCLYSGNMGEKQGIESIVETARLLEGRDDIRFVFCGAGAARDRVAAMAAGLPNVTLLPVQSEERLNELLNLADIHLLPQRADTGSFAMPSKVGNILASGGATVFQAPEWGELTRILNSVGLRAEPGDAAGTARQVLALAGDPDLRLLLGRSAREAAETLSRGVVLREFEFQARALALSPATGAASQPGWGG